MGIYTRPDSKYWWALLDGYDLRESTKIPHTHVNPKLAAEFKARAEKYWLKRMAALAETPVETREIISFTQHSQWYAAHHAAHLRGAVRVRSMLKQLGLYFDHVADLAAITSETIREWMTWRKRQVGPNTVNRELDVLKSLLRAAVPRYLAASPAADLRRFRIPEQERRILTEEEEARLLAVSGPSDRAWLILAIDTLLRLSNTILLRWPQVKLDRGVIVPLNAKVAHDVVPISARLAAALTPLQQPDGYVFAQFHDHAKGGTQAAQQKAIRRFDLLCQLAGVPHGRAVDGITFHGLRHTGATRALQRGASVRTVMKLGGWKDERMVMRYVHASDADVRAAAESIGAAVNHVSENVSEAGHTEAFPAIFEAE